MIATTPETVDLRLLTGDDLFIALVERDRRVDGRVFYGITTTGIYCRPVCPARKPMRKNVRFFLSPTAAEKAGFRACLRCRPESAMHDPAMELVERACQDIDAHVDGECSLREIATRIGSSPHHLQRTFKAMLGVSPKEYIAARRIEHFKGSVRSGQDVTSAIYDAGYSSSSRLYERANAELGMTPGVYRDGGTSTIIRCITLQTELGWLLIARTDIGLCAVRLGDTPEELNASLAAEFPGATVAAGDPELEQAAGQITAHLAGSLANLDLPLDVRGTAFQRRVWKALQEIPSGETRTYTQVARAIGQPGAYRAVATACASNPVAIVVPCHRVVRAGGGLAGYRWGIDRKATLLALETTAPNST